MAATRGLVLFHEQADRDRQAGFFLGEIVAADVGT
jgi:hypothetical protein